jgi:cytochrome c-type biogenesis protein CcmH/NrfF/Flp pilus assembly protein TadD
MKSFKTHHLIWALFLIVAVLSLTFSVVSESPPLTNSERVSNLASDFACPVCAGQSLAESDVPVAKTIRATISTMVDGGSSNEDIRKFLVSKFGEDIDYNPTGDGVTGLVWVVPVAAGITALFGTVLILFSWMRKERNVKKSVGKISFILNSPKWIWIALVCTLAIGAGFLVAKTAGSRNSGDAISGEIRMSPRTLLIEAAVAPREEAIEIYNQVLELQPSNAEALAYRGWLLWLGGELENSLSDIESSIIFDPSYPDARAFHAIINFREGKILEASKELLLLDSLNVSPVIKDLLASSRFRESVSSELARSGDLLLALELVDSGAENDPTNSSLLAHRGWLLATSGDQQLAELSLISLDMSLDINPQDPYAIAYKALIEAKVFEKMNSSEKYVEQFKVLPNPPAELVELLRSEGLL